MRRVLFCCFWLSMALVLAAQTPVKTIEDGALDRIEMFVASLDGAATPTVVIKPFDASAADLGTGSKDGAAHATAGSGSMQGEGPRVLAERFIATLGKSGPFKEVRLLEPEEAVPAGALVVEGKFVTHRSWQPYQALLCRLRRRQVLDQSHRPGQGLDRAHSGGVRAAAHRHDGPWRR